MKTKSSWMKRLLLSWIPFNCEEYCDVQLPSWINLVIYMHLGTVSPFTFERRNKSPTNTILSMLACCVMHTSILYYLGVDKELFLEDRPGNLMKINDRISGMQQNTVFRVAPVYVIINFLLNYIVCTVITAKSLCCVLF